ncbi:MAG: polyprenyl synthetase family protein [Thermoleophilaceae bacterium]|nr:polyprenyl synthetase family protein [Thermoleophilaceae bacterium]MDQ3241361.1 polyprenyl synthetase family protein [Actinomycetota bacterium]
MSAGPGSTGAVATSSAAGLGPVLEAGGPELARLLARTEGRLGEVIESYGDRLAEHAAGTLVAGGKRLRPILVYLCAGATVGAARGAAPLSESEAGAAVVHAGAAVELLHMATLVHDDVLDRAALRRGRPTVFRSGGRIAATATGDLLFSRAFAELVMTGDADAVRALSRASTALAHGELMQRADAWRADVSPDRYLERCELKTARLFEAACRLGAILGRPGPEAADALGAFGSRIGIAFQIFDDVLDVSGPAERTGKRRGTDLLDGTVTLPLILARRRDRDLRALDLREVVTDPAQAEAVCDRIALSGALGDARGEALHHVAEAKAALSDLSLPEGPRHALDLVADGVVERYS